MTPRKPIPKELVDATSYDPITGDLCWKTTGRGRTKGPVRNKDSMGAYTIGFGIAGKQKIYVAHRVAWVHMTGQQPPDVIDHINGVKTDNRWENLRGCTHAQNANNMKRHRQGFMAGVSFDKSHNKWRARILGSIAGGKDKHVGHYNTMKQAERALQKAIKAFKSTA